MNPLLLWLSSSLTFSTLRWSSLMPASHSCRSRSKHPSSSPLSRLHLVSPCCSFQRRSRDALWLSASRRRCSSRSSSKAHWGSSAGSPSPPFPSPRTLPCASSSSWLKSKGTGDDGWIVDCVTQTQISWSKEDLCIVLMQGCSQ